MKPSVQTKCNGLTLIELMIAIVLGLILTAGIIQIFISNQQTYRVTEEHSRLQDNARFAMEILSRDIRGAGYAGCRTMEHTIVKEIANAPTPSSMNNAAMLTGSEATASGSWAPSLDAALGAVIKSTDVISIQRASGCDANLTTNMTSTDGTVKINAPHSCNISSGDIFMIADCEDAHVFRVSAITTGVAEAVVSHDDTENQAAHFCKSYPSLPHAGACTTGEDKKYNYDAELLKFTAVTYFIRLGTNGIPALWRYDQTSSGAPIELVEGIENMQILYGIDDDGDNILDRTAKADTINAANDWDKVVSVKVSLLAQTIDQNLTTADQVISFNGSSVDSSDGRLRRVFTSTVAVRNRVQ